MKKINVIIISLFLVTTTLECGLIKDIFSYFSPDIEQQYNFDKKYSNTKIGIGVHNYRIETPLNCGNENFQGNPNELRDYYDNHYHFYNCDLLNLGLSLKSLKFKNINPNLNFTLLKINVLGNDLFYKFYPILNFNLNLVDYNSNLFSKYDLNWAKIGLGAGYDFLGTLEKHLRLMIFVNYLYTSYYPDIILFDKLDNKAIREYKSDEINSGLNLLFKLKSITVELIAEQRRMSENTDINISTISSKLSYSKYKKYNMGIDCNNVLLHDNFILFGLIEYKKLMIAKQSQGVMCFSLGFQYLF